MRKNLQADLVEMYQLKANRIDADELAKLQARIAVGGLPSLCVGIESVRELD